MWKHKRLWALVGTVLGIVFLWQAPTAFADAYPYANTPCVWAPYASSGTRANWCPDYDWGTAPGEDAAASVISPYGYAYRNCTDYTAWKVSMLGIDPTLYKGLGNAKNWAARAASKGLRVDAVPAPGAVAVRTTGLYGHTAYVEAVDAQGALTVSHYNYRADGNYGEQYGLPMDFGFTLFVHFEDLVAPPPLPVAPPAEPLPPVPPEPEVSIEAAVELVAEVAVADTTEVPSEADQPIDGLEPATSAQEADSEPVVLAAAATAESVVPPPAAAVAAEPPAPPQPAPRPAVPAPPVWRQAVASPPTAAPARPLLPEPVAAAAAATPLVAGFSYWPLFGLSVVLFLHATVVRRFCLQ